MNRDDWGPDASSLDPSDNGEAEGVVLLWSGGKDAMMALDRLLDRDVSVRALLCTCVEEADRVTVHGTPRALIEAQADALGIPLHVMPVPPSPSNATYEERLERALAPLMAEGIRRVASGDLFLDDVRDYREGVLQRIGASPLFPVWETDTTALAHAFLDRGSRAVVASVDTTQLDASFAGRKYDADLLADLPDAVDPCGENGEFHTFVYDGPRFASAVDVTVVGTEGEGRMRYATLRLA